MSESTAVLFRVWRRSPYSILALFPYELGDQSFYTCSSYEHIGQHGAAHYMGCIQATRPAKPAEYADLKRELRSIGYHLRIIHRVNWNLWHKARKEEN